MIKSNFLEGKKQRLVQAVSHAMSRNFVKDSVSISKFWKVLETFSKGNRKSEIGNRKGLLKRVSAQKQLSLQHQRERLEIYR